MGVTHNRNPRAVPFESYHMVGIQCPGNFCFTYFNFVSIMILFPSSLPAMRLLCLHGHGTNSQILEAQLEPLRSRLPGHWEFEFLDGEMDAPPPTGIVSRHGGNSKLILTQNAFLQVLVKSSQDHISVTMENLFRRMFKPPTKWS